MTTDLSTSPGHVAPDGRRMLRIEARNAETPIERKPPWIKTKAKMGPEYTALQSLVQREGLHTVCQEAGCPNIYECWEDREATFLIGGDQCTRRCDFCQIDTGKPADFDPDEPRRVAESVATMGLRYATITGVARDDLPDGGAWLYAETVRQIHALLPGCGVELLIPDFNAVPEQLAEVFGARPEVLAHNLETVPRIFKRIRPAFRYERSLDVITQARAAGLVTKSNLILGMGEEREEISQALRDLHEAGCELITITQYLRPTPRHHPVERWVKPEEFVELADRGHRDRLRRRDERSAGALVLPRRPALPAGARRPDAARRVISLTPGALSIRKALPAARSARQLHSSPWLRQQQTRKGRNRVLLQADRDGRRVHREARQEVHADRAAASLRPITLALLLILFAGLSWIWLALGVMLGLLGFMIVLNLRANKAMMAEAEASRAPPRRSSRRCAATGGSRRRSRRPPSSTWCTWSSAGPA